MGKSFFDWCVISFSPCPNKDLSLFNFYIKWSAFLWQLCCFISFFT